MILICGEPNWQHGTRRGAAQRGCDGRAATRAGGYRQRRPADPLTRSNGLLPAPERQKGADRSAPFCRSVQCLRGAGGHFCFVKIRYCSLPTKPNLVTPEALMMFSTRADSS